MWSSTKLLLLQQRGRLTYRALQYQFNLDDAALSALKEELIEGQEVALDKDGKMLVWKGNRSVGSAPSEARGLFFVLSLHQLLLPPAIPRRISAERIRAEQAALEARGAVDGERKTITALFADLKGSTALDRRTRS